MFVGSSWLEAILTASQCRFYFCVCQKQHCKWRRLWDRWLRSSTSVTAVHRRDVIWTSWWISCEYIRSCQWQNLPVAGTQLMVLHTANGTRPTHPSIPSGSGNEDQLWLERQLQMVWWHCVIPWHCVPFNLHQLNLMLWIWVNDWDSNFNVMSLSVCSWLMSVVCDVN